MRLALMSRRTLAPGAVVDLRLSCQPNKTIEPGARLWLLWDVQQYAGWPQTQDEKGENYLSVRSSSGRELIATVEAVRLLDLYPVAPESLGLAECRIGAQGLGMDDRVEICVRRWRAPWCPIAAFRFWLVVDREGAMELATSRQQTHRMFVARGTGERISHAQLVRCTSHASLAVPGEYEAPADIERRRTPQVYWGDLHGMATNQRPLDDFYSYAKTVSRLDFCAPLLFSYNTCVRDVWKQVTDAAERHTEPGRFIALAGFECATPPDASCCCAYFPKPNGVPPIFCETGFPAEDSALRERLHPDSVICKTRKEFYETVDLYDGFLVGYFRTAAYGPEALAEVWQKQQASRGEQGRVMDWLRRGRRLGLVGGSGTHDSMPGNPKPEPDGPRPTGLMAAYADALTVDALVDAIRKRRVYATTGARLVLEFDCGGEPMGSELALHAPRKFHIAIYGTHTLSSVELLKDGRPMSWWYPKDSMFEVEVDDAVGDRPQPSFYLVRVEQMDGHKAWSSPIWFA